VTQALGKELILMENCTSTFDIAEEFALSGASHGLTIVAKQQTEGHGRSGRTWLSPPGGLWLTIVLRAPELFPIANGIPLLGALSVARTINSMSTINSRVKWPNDVVIRSDKVSGILAESRFEGNTYTFTLLGIGVNVNFHSSLLQHVNQNSTTILSELNRPTDISLMASKILNETERILDLGVQKEISSVLELLRAIDYSRGKNVKIKTQTETTEGIFHDYRSLTEVEINTNGEYVIVETGTAKSVAYEESTAKTTKRNEI
jgi:BirA family transcriptional regulator, biotin operon repressor / biotin---[acetyl-CoA-carboxylase] ligase